MKLIEKLPMYYDFPRTTRAVTDRGKRNLVLEKQIDELDRKAENYLKRYMSKRKQILFKRLAR